MKAAVTLRTRGHLSRARMVMALPNSPTIMKMVMSTAVSVISEGENLSREESQGSSDCHSELSHRL